MRLALLQKRGDSFLEISSLPDGGVIRDRAGQLPVELLPGKAGEERLRSPQRCGAVFEKLAGKLVGAVHQLVGRDHFVDQPQLVGLLRAKEPSGKQQISCAFLPDVRYQVTGNNP